MARLALISLTVATLAGGHVHGAAADVAAGNAAFSAGDFRGAYTEWAPLAAEGDAGAQRGLGMLFDQGLGVTPDAAAAIRWFNAAAAQGDTESQYRLGRLAAEGRGGPVSAADAAQWFRKAATQGHGQAQASLGALYLRGFGVQQNSREAARWFREAAEQEIATAQFGLAALYVQGDGVPRDLESARQWYRRADGNGHPGAARELAALSGAAEGDVGGAADNEAPTPVETGAVADIAPEAPAPVAVADDPEDSGAEVERAPAAAPAVAAVADPVETDAAPAAAETAVATTANQTATLDRILQEWAGAPEGAANDSPAEDSASDGTPVQLGPFGQQATLADDDAVEAASDQAQAADEADDGAGSVVDAPTVAGVAPVANADEDAAAADTGTEVAALAADPVGETGGVAEGPEARRGTFPRPKPPVRPRRGQDAVAEDVGTELVAAVEKPVAPPPPDIADTEKLAVAAPTVAAVTLTPASAPVDGVVAFPADGPSDAAFADGLAAYLAQDYDAAIAAWEALADQGNPFAELGMGWLYENGGGVPADPAIAVAFYRVAANNGVAEAHYRLSELYRDGRGVNQDDGEADRRLAAALTAGLAMDPPALPEQPATLLDVEPASGGWWARIVGAFDRAGSTLNQAYAAYRGGNEREAAVLWRRLADDGVPAAQFALARAYAEGRGVPRDAGRAVEWLEKAATGGHGPAMHNLGVRLALGLGTTAAPDDATRWFERALARGIGESRLAVGLAYAKGLGVRGDPARAHALIAAAGDEGLAAQLTLGVLQAEGLIDGADPARAVEHFTRAAAAGSTAAEAALGALLAAGVGGAPDRQRGIELLTGAARAGDGQAQYNLGVLMAYGAGGEPDLAAGFSWLTLAAANGEARAERLRALMQQRLSADELARAEELTAAFEAQEDGEKAL